MNNKIINLGILCSAITLIFFIVLFKLQVIDRFQYQKQVKELALRQTILQPPRGRIFDRENMVSLAYNESAYQIYLVPQEVDKSAESISNLSNLLQVSNNILYELIKSTPANLEKTILDNLIYEEALPFIEKIQGIKGVGWKRIIQRKYSEKFTLGHVIGFIGDISASELQTFSYKGYRNFDVIGKAGIEKQYEDFIRGKTGSTEERVNVFGETVRNSEEVVRSIQPGHDLILTLDLDIQDLVEKTLGNRVGAVVVMKPSNGEILAMASYPSYNSNLMVNSSNVKLISEIQRNRNSPFLNRAIQATKAPASTFKAVMATAFLDTDIDNHEGHWDHTVKCPGWIKIGDRIFRCWVHSGHGRVNYINALAVSCNVFFYSIGNYQLGLNNIFNYANMFGYGQLTEIDLPGEVPGILPSDTWKESIYGEEWFTGDTVILSIGEGYIATTPLQLATVVSAFVNNGTIYRPHLLKEVREQVTGKLVYTYPNEILREVEVSEKVFIAMKKALRNVVESGTASSVITTDAVEIAGKTGSGQVEKDNFENLNSWFISFGPHAAPPEEQIVVVVLVEAVNTWEWWAPKAANIIYHGIYTKQNYDETVNDLIKKGTWYLPVHTINDTNADLPEVDNIHEAEAE